MIYSKVMANYFFFMNYVCVLTNDPLQPIPFDKCDVNLILKNYSAEMNLLTIIQNIYDIVILNKYVRATALDRRQGIYCIEENDWSDICKLCYFCTREIKLQSLQFRIVHRIIPCKKNEKHDQNSPSYEMRKEGKVNGMTHHFIECSGLNNVWNVFEN